MAIYLRYLNELTVNGTPIEDENEDDYTVEEPEEETTEGEADDELDLTTGDEEPTETENTEEEPIPDDYTLDPEEPTEGEENTDDELDLTTGTAEPAAETEEPTDGTTEPETGDEGGEDLDLTTDDDTEASAADGGDSGVDDYTVDDPESAEGEEVPTDEEQPEDNPIGDGEDELQTKIKQTEAEIFDTLTPEEKVIKNRDLIDSYVTLKNVVKLFLDKVRSITLTDQNTAILQFVETCLVDLGNIISDYIIERFSNKTYIENFVMYQQIVLTVEQLNDIISKLNVDENPKK